MARWSGMERDGDVEHNNFRDGSVVSVRRDWTPDDATEGLVHDWLNPRAANGADIASTDVAEHVRAWTQPRTIRGADGTRLGVLVSPEQYDEGQDAIHQINQDAYGQSDEGYKPFQHAPNATTDRIVNTEVLETVIRKLVHGTTAEPDDLTKEERDRIHYASLVAAIEFRFDPDSRGIIPVMTPNRASDSVHREFIWSFLYPTPVAGLFIRPDDAILGSIEYTLTAGSGYAVVGGFWERDYAEELAVKLAEATPGQNWYQLDTDSLTTELRATYVEIIRAHGRWRKEAPADA